MRHSGTVPVVRAQIVKLFLVFTNNWQENVAKIPKSPVVASNNMVCRPRAIYCPLFNKNNCLTSRQFLRDEILLTTKLAKKMLIEQIIEFELRRSGLPGRTFTPTIG